jgi:hypothetical protein
MKVSVELLCPLFFWEFQIIPKKAKVDGIKRMFPIVRFPERIARGVDAPTMPFAGASEFTDTFAELAPSRHRLGRDALYGRF